ncbi:metallophosphoesterase family protein [Polynucleobacter kasalickyi]|uniref:Calcineurin-like phosphoesterase superfamily domain-containing protein n=1 Tax=Polynucleobacter kasalickyi TaxID=1938817 RepID=A0A1W1ZSJ2_9BURK|nr:metallophosphoesterase family protein [Polynucleobacter kasalickyi]SMC51344.1 Calcineurin-like phosphoesterase superfamily domain-containing protein [Polynucleobacter kasalickyi]
MKATSNDKIALFADIHSNIEALEACLKHADEAGATRYVFLGDLIGYNASPVEVLERVMTLIAEGKAIAVKGNHDQACYENNAFEMNPEARVAIDWTISQLEKSHLHFLKNLPYIIREEDRCYVHASAQSPEKWLYVNDGMSAWRCAEASEKTYTFVGHVHDQALFFQSSVGKLIRFEPHAGDEIPIGHHRRWVSVVGSTGQPRDGSPKANYALFDVENESLYFHRVSYNHEMAAKKVQMHGLPDALAKRLLTGN